MENPIRIKANQIITWLYLALGIIHCIAFIVVFPDLRLVEPFIVYMYMMTGVALIIISTIQLLLLKLINKDSKRIGRILSIIAFYYLVSGISAVPAMIDNPFAYITLVLAIINLYYTNKLNKSVF